NVTSFIQEKNVAVAEYDRILKPCGVLAAGPIYYQEQPPESLKREVEGAIGVKIEENTLENWINIFKRSIPALHLYFREDYRYDYLSEERISTYARKVMVNVEIADAELAGRLGSRLRYFYRLFNENLRYCGFSILLFRKTSVNSEPELYTSYRMTR